MAEEQGVGVGRGSLTEALGAALGTAAPAPQENKEAPNKEGAPKDNAEAKPPAQAQTPRPQGGPRPPRPGPISFPPRAREHLVATQRFHDRYVNFPSVARASLVLRFCHFQAQGSAPHA